MMHAAYNMARLAALVIASLAQGACGPVQPAPDPDAVAVSAARLLARAVCAATVPAPSDPLWHSLAHALLCPPPAPTSEVP